MACNDEFRHVCVKDLENYIRKDNYFSDFTPEEIAIVLKNLGIEKKEDTPSEDIQYNPTLIKDTYNAIYNMAQASQLKVGYVYIITDFRSIYKDKDGVVCGVDSNVPSEEYYMYLTPNSPNTFDKRVRLYLPNSIAKANSCSDWIVEYDITPARYDDVTTKGTITFLKDNNNNYAYYDFKNIKFKKSLSELNKGADSYTSDTYLYTFDANGKDSSENTCKNNHLEKGAIRNVFLGSTLNVTLAADCHDNIFFKTCENCTFDYGTNNNFFKSDVKRCVGPVHDKELDDLTSANRPKRFDILDDKLVMTYLDSETLQYQIQQL